MARRLDVARVICEGAWRPVHTLICCKSLGRPMFFLQEVRHNQFHRFLSNAGFYLTARIPIVQQELISGYLGCPLELNKLVSFGSDREVRGIWWNWHKEKA